LGLDESDRVKIFYKYLELMWQDIQAARAKLDEIRNHSQRN